MKRTLDIVNLGLVAAFLAACSAPATFRYATDAAPPPREASATDARPPEDASRDRNVAPPALTALAVSPLILTPSFEPDIYDYYVTCSEGMNTLSVSMQAGSGAEVAITAPAASAESGRENVTIDVAENEAIVVAATRGAASTSYWIRCLPHDFPKLMMLTDPNAGTPTPGYYLVGNTLQAPNERGFAMALDVNGVPVWYNTTQNGNGGANVDVRNHDVISYVGNLPYTFSNVNGAYEIHGLEDGSIEYIMPDGSPLDVHELRELSNGHFLVFARPIEAGVNLTGLASYTSNEYMVNCVIHEVDSTGATVWQWTATDHLDPVQSCTFPAGEESAITSRGRRVIVTDPFHCNSIDVAPNGDLLVSARHTDSIFLISRVSGKILWKMGGTSYTKDGATYLTVMNDALHGFYRQHDARLHSDGTISVFDDRTAMPGSARGLLMSYDVDAGSASVVWQYAGSAGSQSMGSFRLQADGSRIIGWGASGGRSPVFTEIDAKGNAVLEFVFPTGESSYRAIKVSKSDLDIDWMRKSAGVSD
jgi:hypothetical protein